MSSLTRWVLAHKRTVVLSPWLVLTIAGLAAAGPATDALEPGSVPGKEGWETNEAIAARYGDTGVTPRRSSRSSPSLQEGGRLSGSAGRAGRYRRAPA